MNASVGVGVGVWSERVVDVACVRVRACREGVVVVAYGVACVRVRVRPCREGRVVVGCGRVWVAEVASEHMRVERRWWRLCTGARV